jgi:ribosomal protein L29
MAKKTDISKKNDVDLVKALGEHRESLRAFRFGEAGGRSRNVREGRATRKEIARILTELTRRSNETLASKA